MTIYHIVMFKFKALVPADEVDAACQRMLALKTNCKHPESKEEYVKVSVGGLNNSPENAANGFTHAFISQFDNEKDRTYYLEGDPAHLSFVKSIGDILDKHQVIDFTPGIF
ncbi:stress responsive A/B barrel domain-containing protein [Truncatella angustata]|uniref:Stress responsive A/B barrel domain-containing protein n=1 Tax=Truncatella angustata TaxID=152316 RepID=A0A9P8ZWC9_9PEZI|nr:stress responsive A/B barrel domain-containing protein [Truncatella angustata]KAH6651977.1 stress responsive A/B barrel domain-containing protein [Truncatella angustata]